MNQHPQPTAMLSISLYLVHDQLDIKEVIDASRRIINIATLSSDDEVGDFIPLCNLILMHGVLPHPYRKWSQNLTQYLAENTDRSDYTEQARQGIFIELVYNGAEPKMAASVAWCDQVLLVRHGDDHLGIKMLAYHLTSTDQYQPSIDGWRDGTLLQRLCASEKAEVFDMAAQRTIRFAEQRRILMREEVRVVLERTKRFHGEDEVEKELGYVIDELYEAKKEIEMKKVRVEVPVQIGHLEDE